uniref:Lachesin n=1 Tax=Cacopsylla melanoneura TaxID=428564 RepID=A0A8D9B1R7_9HEMI
MAGTTRHDVAGGVLLVFLLNIVLSDMLFADVPKFVNRMSNVTVTVGRDATFACSVDNISNFKIAWLRVDTQTILTIQNHVVTKNHRIVVTHSDHRTWYLHIKETREKDRGWYMCQVNTEPMKNQVAYLEVVVPPDILDYPTSSDMIIRENTNVTLECAVRGSPTPVVSWRREDSVDIVLGNTKRAVVYEGTSLTFQRVSRKQAGAYLCIASNGVPPSVSKRISLIVHFPPLIVIPSQLIGAKSGAPLTLDCHVESFPNPISFWTHENGSLVSEGPKYHTWVEQVSSYKMFMRLHIGSLSKQDFGTFKCIAKNTLGGSEGVIKVYNIGFFGESSHYVTDQGDQRSNQIEKSTWGLNQSNAGSSSQQSSFSQRLILIVLVTFLCLALLDNQFFVFCT